MSVRRRRLAAAVIAVLAMVAIAVSQRRPDPPRHIFRVTLGLADTESTDWSGRVTVEGGDVTGLEGWRFEGKDAIDGKSGWKCRTHDYIVPGARFPLTPASG